MADKVVITYGSFDLFHIGHLRLLERLRSLGDTLIVGVSSDEFNAGKNKRSFMPFEQRIEIVRSLKCVDLAIPENSWEQKVDDIKRYGVSIFGMGDDWKGHFDDLSTYCEVVYLPRTQGISSSEIKKALSVVDRHNIDELKRALDLLSSLVDRLE